jgi:O-antigen/teichoic acid export membrane protein
VSKNNQAPVSGNEQYFRTEHLMPTIGGRTARGGVVTVLFHGLKFFVSIIATAILARLLTPGDYGLIGMVAVATNFVSLFKDMGLSLATVQRSEISYAQISTLFWVNVTLSAGIMVLMIGLAPAVARFYAEPRLTAITMVTALGFIFGGLTVQHEALMKRQMRFFALGTIAFVSMALGYAVGIALAWHGIHYWALVFSQLALLATNAVGVWLLCGWRPGSPKRNAGVKSMLSFGGNITGYSLVNYFSKNSDNLLIGRVWGAQQLGLYGKAAQLVGLPTDQINEPLTAVAIPALSRLSDSPERYRNAYLRIMEKVIMLTMPAVALLIASSHSIVYLVLGPQWSNTAQILMFMGIAGLFQPVVSTGGWLLVTQGRTRHMLYWSLLNAPLSILSIVIGLRWGAVGVAASYSLVRVIIANPLLFWFVGRVGPVRTVDFYRLVAPFACASTTALLACWVSRKFVVFHNPITEVSFNAAMIGLITLLVLSLIPAGRAALMDIKHSLFLLRPSRNAVVAVQE